MANLVKTFHQAGDFEAMWAAEDFLRIAGFSIGPSQKGAPRGIMYGDCGIAKWRNLDQRERIYMDGQATGSMRNGPVTLTLFGHASTEAKRAFHQTAVTLSAGQREEQK